MNQRVFLVIAIVFVVATTLLFTSSTAFAASTLSEQINQQRQSESLPLLLEDELLSRSAAQKAAALCSISLGGLPTDESWDELDAAVPEKFMGYGEVLAKGFTSYESAVSGWLLEPSTRSTLAIPLFTSIGSAVYDCAGVQLYVVRFGVSAITQEAITTEKTIRVSAWVTNKNSKVIEPPAVPATTADSRNGTFAVSAVMLFPIVEGLYSLKYIAAHRYRS